MNRTSKHLVSLLYTALAAAVVLLAITGGGGLRSHPRSGAKWTMLIAGLCIAVAAAAMAAVAWRRFGPIGAGIATAGWWKFIAAGPCIIVAVIVAAGLGVEAWFVGVLAVLVAFVLTGTGLLLGLMRLNSFRRCQT